MADQLSIDVTFRDEDADEVVSLLDELGGQDVERVKQRGMTGIEILVVVVLASQALANLIIKLIRLWKCGLVVDVRGPRVSTEKNCDLPRGSVLVISPDGTETKLHEPSQLELDSVIKAALSGGQ